MLEKPLKLIYLDQNAWQYLFEQFSTEELKKQLKKENLLPYLSAHNIYEFGRLFIDLNNAKKLEKGKKIFACFKNLEVPLFLKQTEQLLQIEIQHNAIVGVDKKCMYFEDSTKSSLFLNEIAKLSIGDSENAREFISNRDGNEKKDHPYECTLIKDANKGIKLPKEFNLYRSSKTERIKYILLKYPVLENQSILIDAICDFPNKFPCINALVSSEMYRHYLSLTHKEIPSRKSNSDHRHIINSCLAYYFVTGDKSLYNKIPKISELKNGMLYENFKKMLFGNGNACTNPAWS
jgi:hypothetical protein